MCIRDRYNIPGRCSINMEGDTILRLAHNCDNVVAIKEASGNFCLLYTSRCV